MSTKNKKSGKAPSTGIRYTDAQKKEIVDFVAKYNATNGRGGQSAASAKYKVTPLTISGWLKSAGVKAPKAKKAAKESRKESQPRAARPKRASVTRTEFKNEVVDFVEAYNAKNGRGGQNQAVEEVQALRADRLRMAQGRGCQEAQPQEDHRQDDKGRQEGCQEGCQDRRARTSPRSRPHCST